MILAIALLLAQAATTSAPPVKAADLAKAAVAEPANALTDADRAEYWRIFNDAHEASAIIQARELKQAELSAIEAQLPAAQQKMQNAQANFGAWMKAKCGGQQPGKDKRGEPVCTPPTPAPVTPPVK